MKTIFYHGLGESPKNYKNLNMKVANIDWNKVKATSAKGYKNIVSFSLGVVFALDEATKHKVDNLILCSPTPFEHLKGIKAKKIWILLGEKENFQLNIFKHLKYKENLNIMVIKKAGHKIDKNYLSWINSLIQ